MISFADQAILWLLAPLAGNVGLWSAFLLFVVLRAVALAIRYPSARNRARSALG